MTHNDKSRSKRDIEPKIFIPLLLLVLVIILCFICGCLNKKYKAISNRQSTSIISTFNPSLSRTIATPIDDPDIATTKITGKSNGETVRYTLSKIALAISLPKELASNTFESYRPYDQNTQRIGIYCFGPDCKIRFNDFCQGSKILLTSHTRKGFSFEREGFFYDLSEYKCDQKGCGPVILGQIVLRYEDMQYKLFTNSNGVKILKVYGEAKYPENSERAYAPGTPGEGNIGAIINLPDDSKYSGISITMNLSNTLTEEIFDQILDSIKIVK